jgi:F1F0 ATPase subunit 2
MELNIFAIAGSFIGGLGLGAAYCAMLWLAVRRLRAARRPIVWLVATAVPRIAVPLAGFYWIMQSGWMHLMAGLAGFLLARLAVQYWATARGSEPPGRAVERG